MLTITNYNQQTPSFQAQMKMGKASTKLGQYIKNKGINPNAVLLTSASAAGIAGSVMMFSPDAISAPDAAKWALGGGMTSTLGLMGRNVLKNKKSTEPSKDEMETVKKDSSNAGRIYEVNDNFLGHVFLTKKGIKQYSKILKKIEPLNIEANNLRVEAQRYYQYWYGREYQHTERVRTNMYSQANIAEQKIHRIFTDADKQMFIKDGEL